jgi:serine/arginine repetitive matrix protein 2
MRDAVTPSLSRRFTLLRAPSGNPVSLGDLKSRLREQRTRGAENHLSEEEMDSLLQTLGRLRSKPSTSSTSGDTIDSLAPESLRSTETTTSSLTPSPRSTKRYSNNMFGSGKFRDHTYLRSVAKERTGKGNPGRRSTNSSSPTTAGRTYKISDTPIPEDAVQSDLEPSSHDSDTTPLASGVESSVSELERGILKTFQPGHVRRASLALEEVIREIEEEVGRDGDGDGDGDDKILIPRSPAPERASSIKRRSVSGCAPGGLFPSDLNRILSHAQVDKSRPVPPSESNIYETGTAVSPDPLVQVDAAEFRSTPSPYPRAETSPIPRRPGYIPGMPRPMTPREATFDPDDVSPSSSSTPRATSPRIPGTDRATSPTNTLRRDSVRQSHRTSSPLLASPGAPIASLLSGVNGRFTPDRSQTPDSPSVELGNPHDSSLLGRRRPVSPFSQGTYQSMTMSSRPTTPSNVTWKAPASPSSGNAGGHSRSGSAVGFSEIDFAMSGLPSQVRNGFDRPSRDDSHMSSNDLQELNRSGSLVGNRSLRSPPLPDSPVLEATQSNGSFSLSRRGQLSSIGSDIGSSPFGSAALRSSTPTQYPPRSSASPTLSEHDLGRSSRRGSRQATASPFTLNQSQTLVLSPLANSSRSSLESAGSSYHTWEADKQDRVLPIVAALEPRPPAWHDLSNPSSELSLGADRDVEEIVQQYSGLNKADFVAIQDRLVFAARLKAAVPESRERKNSLRKRRPSTSQSVSRFQSLAVSASLNDA